jgi:hypothetical protein
VSDEKRPDPLDPDPSHYMLCPDCGGTIDMSNLSSVLWHQTHKGESRWRSFRGCGSKKSASKTADRSSRKAIDPRTHGG